MPPIERGLNPIRPCTGPCGRMTRQAKVSATAAPGTVARVDGSMCSTCKRAKEAEENAAEVAARAAEALARKEAVQAERLAAAHRAREAVERDRAARARARTPRRVDLGQSMVRI